MGAFQSKVWNEVASSGSPGSPSENQPLSNNGKPVAPFRDPRSISDDVERTPIQIAADKRLKKSDTTNEAAKENVASVEQTPTGPSFAGRFMAASIDPRSPGGQSLTRTPILLKTQNGKIETPKEQEHENCLEKENTTVKPIRGTATFVDKLVESAEIEELLESTTRMEIAASAKENIPATNEFVSAKDEDEKNGDNENDDQQQKHLAEVPAKGITTTPQGSSILESDCRSPLLIEDHDSAMTLSLRPGGGILTPSNVRCGKKTMFPMTFGYQEAKSPRSPLGTVSLNTNFMGAGDCSGEAVQNIQKIKPQRLSMGNEMGENLSDKENLCSENRSLVI